MSTPVIDFFTIAARLKTLPRAGWRRCGVETGESVAEHTFGVALLALVAAAGDLDRDHCVALALVHDLAESIVGDLTPYDAIGPEEKHRRERAAIEQLAAKLGDARLVQLWDEFEAGDTPEARLVRDLDVIEMAWQARRYQQEAKLTAAASDGFVESARQRLRTATGRELLTALLRGMR